MMRVESFLHESARRFPDKVALVVGPKRVTYGELNRAAANVAAALNDGGVARGDRVVIFAENSADAVVSLWAVLRAGAAFSIVNPTTKADKLAFILSNCRPSALLTETRLVPTARDALARASRKALVLVSGQEEAVDASGYRSFSSAIAHEATRPAFAGIDLDLAMLVYTSGSTGFPKGVMMTHQNVVAAATSITTYLENTADDVILSVLPLSFDYGLYQVLMAARVGATLVLERSFAFPQQILQRLTEERATGFPSFPRSRRCCSECGISRRAASRICGTSRTPPPRSRRRTFCACRSYSRTRGFSRCTG
jgi:acyl-CoA synthetase (AMP-forming)/AMP-acid ligase II